MAGDLVKFMVRNLVANPEAVRIREVAGHRVLVYEVKVDSRDRGALIGRQGRTIRSVRVLAGAAAFRSGKRATVEVID